MTREELIALTVEKPLMLDGAMGSNLILAGMPRGVCSEKWALEHPHVVKKLQSDYVAAGSRLVYAPTFSANRISLTYMDLADQVETLNREIPKITKEAVDGKAYVGGDMTTCGQRLEPLGPVKQNDLFEAYAEQARILEQAGVDFFIGETLLYLEEAMVLVDAVSSVSDKAILISFTVEGDGTLPFGGNVIDAVSTMEAMGVAAVGINCSMGPDQAYSVIKSIRERVSIPVIAKLNAGMPTISDEGIAVYSMDAASFAKNMEKLVDAGASLVGGCCGTTPEYIKALADIVNA